MRVLLACLLAASPALAAAPAALPTQPLPPGPALAEAEQGVVESSPAHPAPPARVVVRAGEAGPEHELVPPPVHRPHKRKKRPKAAKKKHAKSSPAGKPVPLGTHYDGIRLDTDPGIAVGAHDFAISFTGDRLNYLHRNGTPLGVIGPVDNVSPSFFQVLSPVLDFVNRKLHREGGIQGALCNPDQPSAPQIGCINEIYDGRVVYDFQRNRFWVIANSRANGLPGNGPTRFPLVAVSISEDPRAGFHVYALLREYADWPKLAVFEDYLLIGHHGSTNLWVFDANLLAAGKKSPLVARLTADQFDCDQISVVKQHGKAGHMALVVGVNEGGDDLYLFGLLNPTPGHASPPVLVEDGSLELDLVPRIGDTSPVYRDGKLYLLWDEAAPFGNNVWLRHLRVPILSDTQKPKFTPSTDPQQGYREAVLWNGLGGFLAPGDKPAAALDYVKPNFDVNGRGDAVFVFAAGNAKGKGKGKTRPFWQARYAVLYADEAQPRPVGVLRAGECGGVPSASDNRNAHVDLSTAQSDPADHTTVWLAHARAERYLDKHGAEQCAFRTAVGAVKP